MNALLAQALLGVAVAFLAAALVLLQRHPQSGRFRGLVPRTLRLAHTVGEQFLTESAGLLDRPFLAALRSALDRDLRLAGLAPLLALRDWTFMLAGSFALAALLCLLASLALRAMPSGYGLMARLLLAGAGGVMLAQQWLRTRARTREAGLLRELPAGLELLALSLECGCALPSALEIASRHLPPGALRDILRNLHADLAAGRGRAAALRRLFDSNQSSVIAPTLGALIQAEAAGSSLAPVLRAQARQRTEERFAAAEKAALQAPVKMLLPLISCIFPCTFIVIAFPLVTRFLS